MGRRGGKARGKQAEGEQLTDRERALAALRRSLDSGNAAAVVAAGKALIDFERTDPGRRDWRSHTEVQQARDKLTRKVHEIAVRRGDSRLAEEIRIALGDGAESQVRGTSLDAMLVMLAETGAVTPGVLVVNYQSGLAAWDETWVAVDSRFPMA
jgi:hypothetical protein